MVRKALEKIKRKLFGPPMYEELILFEIAMRGFWDSEQALKELEAFERWSKKRTL